MNIEIFLSLFNWLYIIKNPNVFVKYVFYITREVKKYVYFIYGFATHEI